MNTLQLNPCIPVAVAEGNGWPAGKGYCLAWLDYSQEHFTLWRVAMDEGGEVYDVPQSHIRLQTNVSMGRIKMEDHQLKMLSNQDLIAEYKAAAARRDTAAMNMLLKEMGRRGISVEG